MTSPTEFESDQTLNGEAKLSVAREAPSPSIYLRQLSLPLPQSVTCPVCGTPFEICRRRGRPARFCSGGCRVAQLKEQKSNWLREHLAGKSGVTRRPILSAKHRIFARLLANGEKPIVAYGLAGFVARRGNCDRLARNKNIKAEISWLRGGVAENAATDLNPKQRAFARGLAFGLAPDVAYERAGYARHRHNGQRLAESYAVQAELERLQREDQAVVAFMNETSDAALIDRALKRGARRNSRDQGGSDSIESK